MSDFGSQIRGHVDETVSPVDVDALVEALYQGSVSSDEALVRLTAQVQERRVARWPGWVYAVAAAVVVVGVIGGLAILLSTASQDPVDDPPVNPTVSTLVESDTDSTMGSLVELPGRMTTLAAFGNGFVAAGSDEQGPKLWTSTDGVNWAEQDSPGEVTGFVSTPMGLVAVGALPCETSTTCKKVPAVWTSSESLVWDVAYRMDETLVRSGDAASMVDVVFHQDMLVGETESCPSEDGSGPCRSEIWISNDGVTWSVPEPFKILDDGWWFEIAVGDPGILVAGSRDVRGEVEGAVWLSANGTTWEALETVGLESTTLALLTTKDGGFIAVGTDHRVFTSADAVAWSQVSTGEPFVGRSPGSGGAVRAILTVSDRRIIAVGSTCEGAAVWVSRDGEDWNPVFWDEAGQLRAIVEHSGRLVAIGRSDGQTTLAWISELDSLSSEAVSNPPGRC